MPNPFIRNFLLIQLFFIVAANGIAQSYSVILFDNSQSEIFGAKDLSSLHKALYTFQDKTIPDTLFRENKWWKKSTGFVYRMARLWLFDAQIDYQIALAQHEVFGHGARFREMGYQNNSFHMSLFFPYGSGHGFARSGNLKKGNKISEQENVAMTFAGNEANQLLANTLSAQMLLDRSIHYRQALLYLISQNNLISYIWYTRVKKNSPISYSNDISSYIFGTRYLYHDRGKSYTLISLSEQSLVSLANPLQLYAAYTLLYSYGVKGKKQWKEFPMIRMGKLFYLPALNYSFTPFGSQYHLVNYLKYKYRLFTADLHYSDNRYFDFYGIDLSANNIIDISWLTLSASAAGWSQPKLELESFTTVLPSVNTFGGMFSAEVMLHPLHLKNNFGLYLQLGYKTKGYLPGETLDKSLILRYGLSGRF